MKLQFNYRVLAISLMGLMALSGCNGEPDSQTSGQHITEEYAAKLSKARPYPVGEMNDSAERANLTERLLRMNNPNKIGYVTELSDDGKIIAMFAIKGKVSSTGSQLTPTQNVIPYTQTAVTVDSMGDDGSFGPSEGGPTAIFFFTTTGVLVEWNGKWNYSDAPLNLTTKPVIFLGATAHPTSTAGVVK